MSTHHSALDVLAVGLGKTGGKIAGELCRRGYPALAIHSSRRALDEQLRITPDRCCFVGGDQAGGTGGNPEVGRAMVRDGAARIEALVGPHSGRCDVVLAVAALGGGTGSAIGELAHVLKRNATRVVAMVVLPTEGDAVERRAHALRAVKELTEADLDGVVLIDGDKLADKGQGVSILDFDARSHERVVDPFEALDKIEGRDDLHSIRPLRSRQLLEVLTHGGVVSMGAYAVDELTTGTVLDALTQVLQESGHHPDGLELRTTSAVQIVIEAPERALRGTPVQMIDSLREDVKSQSPGVRVDVAVYQRIHDEGPVAVHIIASNADLPARIREMVEDVAHEAAATRDKPRKAPTLDLSILDGPAAVSGSEPPISGTSPKEEGTARTGTSDIAPRPDSDLLERGPNAAVYARLVTRYKSTTNDELQRAIARRLEQDRLTDDARVRVLAVGAMAQIGAHVFDAALVAATEDDSPEVRRVAEQGLAHSSPTRRAV